MLELLVVVTLIGIFASVVTMRYGRSLLADFGSQAGVREISLALLQCQRAAISTGDNHFIQFDAGNATSYRVMRRAGGGSTLVDGPRALSGDVAVTVSDTEMEFNFEGQALVAYTISMVGQNRSWRVDVVPISGAIRVSQSTP